MLHKNDNSMIKQVINEVGETQLSTEKITSDVKILYFNAEWCGACTIMTPIIEKNINPNMLIKLDFNNDYDSFEKYNINQIPTIIISQNEEEKERQVGVINEKNLIELIQKYKI